MTSARGIALIFDEMITGFRWAPGGAQERFGVIPDMICFAKGVTSGYLPLGGETTEVIGQSNA